MRWTRLFFLIALFAGAVPADVFGQDRGTVTGVVTERETLRPLPGAQVVVTGTTLGTITNQQGRFVIVNVPAGEREIRASIIGHTRGTQVVTIAAGQTATVNIELSPSAVELEAVIATATGQEQRLREIGNSVVNIDTDNIELAAVPTITNLLQGRSPGVVVQPISGSVGTGSRIRIRGNSSVSLNSTPLVIIDGIRVSNENEATGLFTGGSSTSRWEDINPEDIESIEILKGPAASALYGTAAANGVVQITTKRGRGGRAEVRTYFETTAIPSPDDRIPTNFRARGFRSDLNARGDCSLIQRNNGTCTTVDSLYSFNPLVQAEGTPLRDGSIGRLGLSVSGGSSDNDVTYFVAGERVDGYGITRHNDIERTNLRANFSGAVNSRLRVNANTNFITSYIQLPQEGNTGSGAWLNALHLADPSPSNVARGQGFRNPYNPERVGWWRNEEDLRRFIGSVGADWRPTDWLSFNAIAGLDQVNRFEQSTIPVHNNPGLIFQDGLREQYRTQDREVTTSLNGTMNRSLTETVMSNTAVGVQFNVTTNDWTYGAGAGLAPGTLQASEALSVQEFFGETKLFGIYGSQQFGINDRLFLTAAVRGDQNSAFGENIGFVLYPALSASWVVVEEPWFPQLDALSMVRLRGAYGESGQRPGRLDAVRTYEGQEVALGSGITSGFVVSNAGNPDLKPEVSKEFEFGFDVGLLDDRVGLDVTRYIKTTTDALVARPLPPSVGGPASQFFNLGEVKNTGWEGSLRLEPIRTDMVDARLVVNFAANKNKLIEVGDTLPIIVGNQRHLQGYPLGGYWGRAYTFEDANGDGIITFNEITEVTPQDNTQERISFMGQPFPTREWSFNGDVNVMGMFRVSALLDHKGGHHIFNRTSLFRCAEATSYCEARQVPGAASLWEQARIMARQKPGLTSFAGFMEPADFWRLREVALTFTVPSEWIGRSRFAQSASISLAGRNLKLWTDYTGLDPETNIPTAFPAGDGDLGRFYTVDNFAIPFPKTFVVRVDLGL